MYCLFTEIRLFTFERKEFTWKIMVCSLEKNFMYFFIIRNLLLFGTLYREAVLNYLYNIKIPLRKKRMCIYQYRFSSLANKHI